MVVCLDALDVNEEWLWWLPVVVVVVLRFVGLRSGLDDSDGDGSARARSDDGADTALFQPRSGCRG